MSTVSASDPFLHSIRPLTLITCFGTRFNAWCGRGHETNQIGLV